MAIVATGNKVTMTIRGIMAPLGSTLSRMDDSTVNVLFLFCIGEGHHGPGEAGEGSGRILTRNCAMLRQRRKQAWKIRREGRLLRDGADRVSGSAAAISTSHTFYVFLSARSTFMATIRRARIGSDKFLGNIANNGDKGTYGKGTNGPTAIRGTMGKGPTDLRR